MCVFVQWPSYVWLFVPYGLQHARLPCCSSSPRVSQVHIHCISDAIQPSHAFAVLGLVTQSCPTVCDPMDCNPPGSSGHGHFLGKNTGVGCHALLQGIFPTHGSKPMFLMSLALAGGFLTTSATLEASLSLDNSDKIAWAKKRNRGNRVLCVSSKLYFEVILDVKRSWKYSREFSYTSHSVYSNVNILHIGPNQETYINILLSLNFRLYLDFTSFHATIFVLFQDWIQRITLHLRISYLQK